MQLPQASQPPMQHASNGYGSAGDDESAPLTYQVYAPEALPPARPLNLSRMSMPDFAPKPNIKARIGLGLVAACVFIGTVVLVIAGAADDKPRAKSAAVAAAAAASASAAVNSAAAAPVIAPVKIGRASVGKEC
ncbi:MAG: hypothetical protein JWO86_2702 [Myxococcaceae bacterium]|nr:hypothetical protein [Myxococcaceae bacterium]